VIELALIEPERTAHFHDGHATTDPLIDRPHGGEAQVRARLVGSQQWRTVDLERFVLAFAECIRLQTTYESACRLLLETIRGTEEPSGGHD